MLIAFLLTLGAALPVPAQTQPAGAITGRITDTRSSPMAGVTISLRGTAVARVAVTDAEGRFALSPLPEGTYQVDAALPGFNRISRTVDLSSFVRRAHLEWSMEVGCIAQVQRVAPRARVAAPAVEAILHVRVTADNGGLAWHALQFCDAQTLRAYGIETLKEVAGTGAPVAEVFTQLFDTSLKVGDEYLVMLWPDALVGDGLIFPIVSGRIVSAAEPGLAGKTVAEAVDLLGQWRRRRRP